MTMLQTKTLLDVEKIRKDFPILKVKVHNKPLVYLDNAATSQKPKQVIDAIIDFYENYNANIHRSIHKLGEQATEAYENARKKAADFINADPEEIIFTKGTTESLNLLAYSLGNELKENDEIVLTQMEHHSNLVPWQQIAKRKKVKLRFVEIDGKGELKTQQFNDAISKKTGIVSVVHASNMLGTINDVEKIGKAVREKSIAYFIVDAAQSVPHMKIDVKKMDCDFLAFSGHKMLGPTGIGVLYGKKHLLEKMEPFNYGGHMIKEVTFKESKWNDIPWKFEAGTANIAQAIGLGAAIDYLKKTGMEKIAQHERMLTKYAMEQLSEIKEVEIYGPAAEKRVGVISFNVKGVHAHDTSAILDSEGIAVRAGHHCTMPLHSVLGLTASARASFYLYNTKEEVDKLVQGIHKVVRVFE